MRLTDGVVRFDLLAGPDLGFYGVAFRAADGHSFEHFYLRPFLGGNPDATQYTPVTHGVSGWQIYAGPGFGGAVDIRTDRWAHVELRFRGARAEALVDGQPVAFPALQRPPMAGGAIGLTAAGAPARFANVVVEDHVPGLEADSAVARGPVPEGLITRWRVSSSFPEARIDSLSDLDPGLARELRWDTLGAGPRGIADIARLRSRDDGRNTAIAAATLRVRDARRVRVRFGFSDRLQLFLDGRPVYRGADGWRSRDYRFLGTVGLFDEVVLDLEPGDHELWFAVSEDFGGWGVVAQVVDGEVGAPVDGDLGDGG